MTNQLTAAHSATMRMDMHQVVAYLNEHLGTTLVAYIADVRSRQLPNKWQIEPGAPGHVAPRDEARKRLILAHQVFAAIEDSDNEYVARQWMVGANPLFDGESPADHIRAYDAAGVIAAYRVFIEDPTGA